MLVIEKCDVPWRRPKAPPLPLPPPEPLPSRQWQPTHQLTHRHFWASGGSHPPFTRDLECAADEKSTAAREMNGDLDGSWLWEASLGDGRKRHRCRWQPLRHQGPPNVKAKTVTSGAPVARKSPLYPGHWRGHAPTKPESGSHGSHGRANLCDVAPSCLRHHGRWRACQVAASLTQQRPQRHSAKTQKRWPVSPVLG